MFPLMRFKIADRSMEPSFKEGDYVIVNKLFTKLRKGDVVVIRHPVTKTFLLKRISKSSENKYFVMGDNKEESRDSRHFGTIGKNLIVGKLLMHIRR